MTTRKNNAKHPNLEGVTSRKRKKTRILGAHRAGATFFEVEGARGAVKMTREITHPEGRLADRASETDRPGRSFDSHSIAHHGQTGGPRHALGSENSPARQFAEQFCAHLARELKEERARGAYDDLVLVAEPRFLGQLRIALDSQTRDKIVRTVEKDLSWLTKTELTERLGELLLPGE
jgi:protein required for attachment to host cells